MYNNTGRPANVYLVGGATVTTIQKSQLMGGQSIPALSTIADFTSAGTIAALFPVRLQPYQWLKINCSVVPTATWDLDCASAATADCQDAAFVANSDDWLRRRCRARLEARPGARGTQQVGEHGAGVRCGCRARISGVA